MKKNVFFDIGITCQKIDRLTEQKSELFGGGREGGKTCQLKKRLRMYA